MLTRQLSIKNFLLKIYAVPELEFEIKFFLELGFFESNSTGHSGRTFYEIDFGRHAKENIKTFRTKLKIHEYIEERRNGRL